MSNNTDWKTQLNAILNEFNSQHASRRKVVSHSTMEARRKGLFRSFALLRAMGFKPTPRNLNNTHIQALMDHWTAHSASAICSDDSEECLRTPDKPYSAAYIQQQLSFLRVFAAWVGKPGMVLAAKQYVDDPELVTRTYTARADRAWSGNGINADTLIDAAAAIDARVAVQLRMLLAFGLRRKEAIMFRPHEAEVPAHALPAGHSTQDRYISFLRIKRGTKGGRLRFAAVRTEAQRAALAEARVMARHAGSHLGHPDLTLKQSLNLFSNVVRAVGLTKRRLGVTPHGLRHQFAGDLYFEIANVQAPVRGGDPCSDPATLAAAYREVALQLGHNRKQISNAYLGSPVIPRSAARAMQTGADT